LKLLFGVRRALHKKSWAVIDRRFYVGVLVNPISLVCVFSFCLTLRCQWCACPAMPTSYRNHDVSRGPPRSGAKSFALSWRAPCRCFIPRCLNRSRPFSCWPGCEVANLVPPNFYPCPESTGTPDAKYALTRLATSMGEAAPIYRPGNE